MSDELRTLNVARSEVAAMDRGVEALFRDGEDETALRLATLALKWQSLGVPVAFVCDIDESAGMAEVVELNSYSRKVLPGCGA